MQTGILKIGTRGSPLALAQAHETRQRLMTAHGLNEDQIEIVVITTTGDRVRDRPLSEIGGKGLFTKEIEEALLAGDIHMAVHSMKDMPAELPDGLVIDCLLPREDVRDGFISLEYDSIAALPQNAIVGSSSVRRQAQIKRMRPDVEVIQFRGNVETRLRKLAEGQATATFLACAGLNRLGMAGKITAHVSADDMLPAVAQGAIGIEICENDAETANLLAPLNHDETHLAVTAERGFLKVLDGSCRTPLAALAEISENELSLRCMVLSPDGARMFETSRQGDVKDAEKLGRDAGDELKATAGPDIFKV